MPSRLCVVGCLFVVWFVVVCQTTTTTADQDVVNFHAQPEENMESLRTFLRVRGIGGTGLKSDLLTLVSRASRMERLLFGSAVITENLIDDYLTRREVAVDFSAEMSVKFDAAFNQFEKEDHVISVWSPRFSYATVNRQTLQLELELLGFKEESLVGKRIDELTNLLANSVDNCLVIQERSEKFRDGLQINRTTVSNTLSNLGLVSRGGMAELLARFANHLRLTPPNIRKSCSMLLSGSVCAPSGEALIGSPSRQQQLVAYWSFDDESMLDHSGNGNHPTQIFPAVSAPRAGGGYSAKMDGTNMMMVEHSESMPSDSNFSILLWLYLTSDANGNWRTLIHKGATDGQRTPTLMLEPRTRGIEFFVSTTDSSQPTGERLWTTSFIPLYKWTHIAAIADGRNLRLFIDGVLDAENTTVGDILYNTGPLYVGNDPWRVNGGVAGLIDDVHIFSRALSVDEIQPHSSLATNQEGNSILLGCISCAFDTCDGSCRELSSQPNPHKHPTTYHICSNFDLRSGTYTEIRNRGWASSTTRIWAAEDWLGPVVTGSDDDEDEGVVDVGLCVCCLDLSDVRHGSPP